MGVIWANAAPRPSQQVTVESGAREIVLRCTNCKRMLQLPPTNLDELRHVQCGACAQLMDVIGPPSIPHG